MYSTRFGQYCHQKELEHGSNFDATALNPNFVSHFNKGTSRRVKVKIPGEEKPVWGFVSVTTGHKPAFLLMRRAGQVGSRFLLEDNCKVIDYKDKK